MPYSSLRELCLQLGAVCRQKPFRSAAAGGAIGFVVGMTAAAISRLGPLAQFFIELGSIAVGVLAVLAVVLWNIRSERLKLGGDALYALDHQLDSYMRRQRLLYFAIMPLKVLWRWLCEYFEFLGRLHLEPLAQDSADGEPQQRQDP